MLIALGRLGGKPRDWIAAIRALLAADALNLRRERLETPQEVHVHHDTRPFFAIPLQERLAPLDQLAAKFGLQGAAGPERKSAVGEQGSVAVIPSS
jgi:hypothetical protein